MAVSDVEAVLQFLRKNGFSEAESALKEDILDKADLGSFDYDKFFFPMMPPPPPVKIPSNTWRSDALPDNLTGSKSTSRSSVDDEFVSLGSSTSGLCSSEFTNPYGIHSTSHGGSEASSDRLSQFGTARDYPDFDMQTDLWYNESDEGIFMTPNFDGQDFLSSQSEDKFIMTLETDKQQHNTFDLNFKYELYQPGENDNYLDKACLPNMHSTENENVVHAKDCGYVGTMNQSDEGFNGKPDDSTDTGRSYEGHIEKDIYPSLKEIHLNDYKLKIVEDILPCAQENKRNQIFENFSSDEWTKKCKDSAEFSKKAADSFLVPSFVEGDEAGNGGELTEEIQKSEASEDELLTYNSQDSGYEVFDLRIIHRKNRTGFEENKEFPIVLNTVIAGRYYVTEYLGSAAFSKVVQARDLLAGMDVCLKIIKNDKDFFDQSLDEIKLLKLVNKNDPSDKHHILRLYDYFYHQEHLFIVCELLRANLYEFQKFNQESGGEAYFTLGRLQIIARQCLEALDFLHGLGIIHCDLKPENILIKNYRRCEIKVIDLGSSCFGSDNLCLYVQSRSYRAPEVILGLPYDEKIDIWSLGCILAELSSGAVLFPNDAVVMILARMIGMLGPIDLEMLENGQETFKYFTQEYDLYHINEETDQLEYIIPEESSLAQHVQVHDVGFVNFVRYLLRINPKRRPTAKQALQHPWLSRVYDSK